MYEFEEAVKLCALALRQYKNRFPSSPMLLNAVYLNEWARRVFAKYAANSARGGRAHERCTRDTWNEMKAREAAKLSDYVSTLHKIADALNTTPNKSSDAQTSATVRMLWDEMIVPA
jgi:hypothetical protein